MTPPPRLDALPGQVERFVDLGSGDGRKAGLGATENPIVKPTVPCQAREAALRQRG